MKESSGGAYEIFLDGKLVFSKHREGRFPEDSEVLTPLKQRLAGGA